jgi:hypothetical protein
MAVVKKEEGDDGKARGEGGEARKRRNIDLTEGKT